MVETCWDNSHQFTDSSSWKSKTIPLAHYPSHFYQYFLKSLPFPPTIMLQWKSLPKFQKKCPLETNPFSTEPMDIMGAVVSPLNQIPIHWWTKMARLKGAALLGLVVLLVVTPLPGFLSKRFRVKRSGRAGVGGRISKSLVGLVPIFFSQKKQFAKTSRKFDNKVPQKIGNPYKWGCFLKPYGLGLMSFYPLPQTNPRKWWFVSKFCISSNGAKMVSGEHVLIVHDRWCQRFCFLKEFPKNPRFPSCKICRIDSVETSHPLGL